VAAWVAADADGMERLSHLPTVQSPSQFVAEGAVRLAPMRRVAYRLYDRWARGLLR
jgi:hypothetical protein